MLGSAGSVEKGRQAYVEPTFELTVSPQLHKHNLVEQQADEIEGLRNGRRLLCNIGHFEGLFLDRSLVCKDQENEVAVVLLLWWWLYIVVLNVVVCRRQLAVQTATHPSLVGDCRVSERWE